MNEPRNAEQVGPRVGPRVGVPESIRPGRRTRVRGGFLRRRTPLSLPVALIAVSALALTIGGCGGSDPSAAGGSSAATCPVEPLKVVVTTNVWGSVVDQLAGACGLVATVIDNPTADPHEFEPTAETSRAFAAADVAVVNGLGYDSWADKIVKSLGDDAPTVVNLGRVVGLQPGDNPHIWYSPDYVQRSARAVTDEFKRQLAMATAAFDDTARAFETSLAPYLDLVQRIRSRYNGTNVGATESVFSYMAAATGLVITTPAGLLAAVAEHSDPAAKDVKVALTQLTDGTDRVLIYNSQVEGSLPERMREAAQSRKVPVVDITETLVPAKATFQEWQVRQLESLVSALGG